MHLFRLVRRAMQDHWALVYFFSIVSSVKCDKTDINTRLNVSFVLSKVKVGWMWFPSVASSGVVELLKNSSPTPTELVGSVLQGQFGIGNASQLWTQFKRVEAWKSQDFNGVWTRDLASVRNCLNCVHNCDDHSLIDFKSAVQHMKYFMYHFTSIPHGLIRTHKWPAPNVSQRWS